MEKDMKEMQEMIHHHGPLKERVLDVATDKDQDLQQDFDELEKTAYSKNSIDDPARFQRSCDIYNHDHKVSHLVKRKSNIVKLILEEGDLHQDVELPPDMTPEHTLSVMCKLDGLMLTTVLSLAEEFLNQGKSVSMQNPDFISAFEKLSIEDIRNTIFKEIGLDQFSDSSEEILSKSIRTYRKTDPNGFNEKMEDVEKRAEAIKMPVNDGNLDLNNIQAYRDQALQLANLYSDQVAPLKSDAQKQLDSKVVKDEVVTQENSQPSTQNQEL